MYVLCFVFLLVMIINFWCEQMWRFLVITMMAEMLQFT